MTKHRAFLWLYFLPIVILLIAACVLFVAGHHDAAWMVGALGTPTWQLIALAYVVLVDSKKRWPDADARQRLGRVMTFTR